MVQGLREDEISLLSSCLKASSKDSGQNSWFPLLLPAILIETKAYTTIEYVNKCHKKIWNIESATNIRAQAIHKEALSDNEIQRNSGERLPEEIPNVDFDDITRGITSVLVN